jgi:hypothetical protein
MNIRLRNFLEREKVRYTHETHRTARNWLAASVPFSRSRSNCGCIGSTCRRPKR